MVAAVVIGLIVSVIDVLVLLIIYFLVNNSKISNEEKRRFNKKIKRRCGLWNINAQPVDIFMMIM